MAMVTLWKTTPELSRTWKAPTARSRHARESVFRPWTICTRGAQSKHRRSVTAARPSGPKGWLEFLDDVGIDWTVMYPTVALSYGKIVSRDYAVAVCKAYNDWLPETYLKFNPRFKGMAIIPMQDPEEAAKELRRAVTELGMLGAMMPSNGLAQPLGAKQYWPIYEEANRLGCCLAVHGGAHDRFGMDHMNMYVPVHALGHPWGLTINCADIVYNGIFERFPRVRIAFLEGGIAWLLLLLERLHASHETHFQHIPEGEFGIREEQDPAKAAEES